MSNFLQVPAGVISNVVGFIELSSLTTKRALDENAVYRSVSEKAAAMRPALLESMISRKLVPADAKEAADAMLSSHETTLQLLKNATDRIAELNEALSRVGSKRAGDLGTGVDGSEFGISVPSNGEYNSLTHPIVGEKTAFVKESDKALMRLIGK